MSERRAEDGWIKHDGKRRPVNVDIMVATKMRNGFVNEPRSAGFWGDGAHNVSNWWHDPSEPHHMDIIAYRVVEVAA